MKNTISKKELDFIKEHTPEELKNKQINKGGKMYELEENKKLIQWLQCFSQDKGVVFEDEQGNLYDVVNISEQSDLIKITLTNKEQGQ